VPSPPATSANAAATTGGDDPRRAEGGEAVMYHHLRLADALARPLLELPSEDESRSSPRQRPATNVGRIDREARARASSLREGVAALKPAQAGRWPRG
jgi:hypothetical protein